MEVKALFEELFRDYQVRIFGTYDKPLFVANDVAKILDMKNIHKVISKFGEHSKLGLTISDPHGRVQTTTVLTESGLYALIIKSRKPIAKEFSDWVFGEVLPTIRKTGQYNIQDTIERQRNDELELSITEKDKKIAVLEKKAEELSLTYKPQITYHEIDPNDFTDEPCVYLFHLHENDFKFGVTGEIDVRTYAHSNNFTKHGMTIKLINLWKCETMKIMKDTEAKIKLFAKHNGILVSKYDQKEILTTDNIDGMVNAINKYVNEQNSREERILKIRELELHNKSLELHGKNMELYNRGIELQIELLKIKSRIEKPEIKVLPETNQIVNEPDAIDGFIAQTNYMEVKQAVNTIYNDYTEYCKTVGVAPITKTMLIKKLKTKGFIGDTTREQKLIDGKRVSVQHCNLTNVII